MTEIACSLSTYPPYVSQLPRLISLTFKPVFPRRRYFIFDPLPLKVIEALIQAACGPAIRRRSRQERSEDGQVGAFVQPEPVRMNPRFGGGDGQFPADVDAEHLFAPNEGLKNLQQLRQVHGPVIPVGRGVGAIQDILVNAEDRKST